MTLRKSLRRVTKILGAKNSTNQNREIKANVLTKLVESANEKPEKRCKIDGYLESIYRLFNLHKVKSGECKNVIIPEEDIYNFRELVD